MSLFSVTEPALLVEPLGIQLPALPKMDPKQLLKDNDWISELIGDTSPSESVVFNLIRLVEKDEGAITFEECKRRLSSFVDHALGLTHAEYVASHQNGMPKLKNLPKEIWAIYFPGITVVSKNGNINWPFLERQRSGGDRETWRCGWKWKLQSSLFLDVDRFAIAR